MAAVMVQCLSLEGLQAASITKARTTGPDEVEAAANSNLNLILLAVMFSLKAMLDLGEVLNTELVLLMAVKLVSLSA